jgi:hypothetical protein
VSQQLAARNNITNCVFIPKDSRRIKRPAEKGDVVVSETLGCFALEENIIDNMEEAKRFLKTGIVLNSVSI